MVVAQQLSLGQAFESPRGLCFCLFLFLEAGTTTVFFFTDYEPGARTHAHKQRTKIEISEALRPVRARCCTEPGWIALQRRLPTEHMPATTAVTGTLPISRKIIFENWHKSGQGEKNDQRNYRPTPASRRIPPRMTNEDLELNKVLGVAVLEEELDGNHVVISIDLINAYDGPNIPTHAIIYNRLWGDWICLRIRISLMRSSCAVTTSPLHKLKIPCTLEVIGGRPIESGMIAYITKLGHMHHSILLGIPIWLKRHDVNIQFTRNTVTFDSGFCLHHCCDKTVRIHGISIPIPEKPSIANDC